jgi:twitching motility protein PilT
MILDPLQTGKLHEVIAEGGYYGMQTFDQALFEHLKAGRIEMEDAVQASTSPHDFKLLVASDGRRGTTMDDLQQAEDERAEGAPVGSALR